MRMRPGKGAKMMASSNAVAMRYFSDIPFTSRSGQLDQMGCLMPGGYWVEKEMFEVAWLQAMEAIDLLVPGKRYSAEELCNPALWGRLWRSEAIMLGRCIKFLVVHGLLPLIEANAGKRGKRTYALDLEALARWQARCGLVQVGLA